MRVTAKKEMIMLILRVGPITYRGNTDTKHLRDCGISSEYVETGHEALELMRLFDYDLILIDLHLADMLGNDMIRMAHAAGSSTPTIILAGRTTVEVMAKALNDGADDFIRLPADPNEILARMRAVVRRTQGHDTSNLKLGMAELSLNDHEVRVNGQKLSVTRREFGVLELLFMKQGVIVTKNDFLNHIYTGVEEPEKKTVDVIICRLRKKLTAAGVPNFIDTVWGCGYILHDLVGNGSDLIPVTA
jgi:two-component system, cell cycle response regulator CtrA